YGAPSMPSMPKERGQIGTAHPPKRPSGKEGTPAGTQPPQMMPPGRVWWWFAALVLLNFLLSRWFVPEGEAPAVVPYTLFKEPVGAKTVSAIYSQGVEINGKFIEAIVYPPPDAQSGATPPAQPSPGWFDRLTGGSGTTDAPSRVSSFETTLPAFVDPG